MIAASPQQQRRLLDLQDIDTSIRQLEHRRANLPEQLALDEARETLDKVNAELATGKERLSTLQRQQARHEHEIATIDSRRKSEEGRMYGGLVSSERELEALRNELSSLKQRKAALEDDLLEIMEQIEELESMVAALTERHGELTAQLPELAQARDQAATDIDAELVEQRARRAEVAGELPEEVVRYYEELRERKQGLAVAPLQGRTCQGCRLELTAIELEEAEERARTGLARCEQCGRILVLA